MHNWHRLDCIVVPHCTHCTRAQFCRMTTSVDNIQWFYTHVSSTYHLLETAVPMADVAMYTIKCIKRLTLTHVSNKVKSDFFRIFSRLQPGKRHSHCILPWTNHFAPSWTNWWWGIQWGCFFDVSFVHAKSPLISLVKTYSARHSIGKQHIWG